MSKYEGIVESFRSQEEYWKQFAVNQFVNGVFRLMNAGPERVSGKQLSKRIGVQPPVVSKWLSGTENLQVETMAKIAFALGAAVHIHVASLDKNVHWTELQSAQGSVATDSVASSSTTYSPEDDFLQLENAQGGSEHAYG